MNAETVTVTFEMDASRARRFLDALSSDDELRRKLLDPEPAVAADALGEHGVTVEVSALRARRITLPDKKAVNRLKKALRDVRDDDDTVVPPLSWCLCLSVIGFALGTLSDDEPED